MSKKDISDRIAEDDDESDDDLDEIQDAVLRSILKNNRIMLRQNERLLDSLKQEEE